MATNSLQAQQMPKDKTDEIIRKFNERNNITEVNLNSILQINDFLIGDFINAIKTLNFKTLSNADLKKLLDKAKKVQNKNIEFKQIDEQNKLSFLIIKDILIFLSISLFLGGALSVFLVPLIGCIITNFAMKPKIARIKSRSNNELILKELLNQIEVVLNSSSLAKTHNATSVKSEQTKTSHQEFIKVQVKEIGEEELHDII
ncbi:MAG: hypothetical protein K2J20_06770, partial [Bacilli bacterium]|nr:hypothetical protein [Bacilli bacterium]